jgi:hypothetical protein
MTFWGFIWNFTEYLAYCCIIIQTGLAIVGVVGNPQLQSTATVDGGLKNLVSTITALTTKFVESAKVE